MTVNRSEDRRQQVTQLRKLAQGLRKHFSVDDWFVHSGKRRSPAEIASILDKAADEIEWIQQTRAKLAEARRARDANDAELWRLVTQVGIGFDARFSESSPVHAEVGLTSRKARQPRTGVQMVETAQKAKRTRTVLGTLGSKQKKALLASRRGG